MTEDQIKHMVDRFLQWRLPENFSPDAGISFKKTFNENSQFGPMEHKPIGTNLLDAIQATAMVRNMIEGMPASADESEFPKPDRNGAGKEPCGECHIQPGETCDICGAACKAVQS